MGKSVPEQGPSAGLSEEDCGTFETKACQGKSTVEIVLCVCAELVSINI